MTTWYTRPVWAITDMDRSLDFYIRGLGFHEDWRHGEDAIRIVQVSRAGCEIILSNQWPERVGRGLAFVSLGEDAAIDALRAEAAARGVPGEDGWWGYRLFVLRDPDGNQLWLNYPGEQT